MVWTKEHLRLDIVCVLSDEDVFLLTFAEQNIIYRSIISETKVSWNKIWNIKKIVRLWISVSYYTIHTCTNIYISNDRICLL